MEIDEDVLYEALDKAGLSVERCKKSIKKQQIRLILIDKYIEEMCREDICYDCDVNGLGYISLSTYRRRLNKGLSMIEKYIK